MLHVLPIYLESSENPLWVSRPEVVRSGFQLLRWGGRLLGLHLGGGPEAQSIPGGTDLGGVAVCDMRPWEPHQSTERTHRLPTSKRTIVLWGRSTYFRQSPGMEDQGVPPSPALCKPS